MHSLYGLVKCFCHWKIYSGSLKRNCIRNHVIAHTYCIHFEITGDLWNLIGSHWCDLFKNCRKISHFDITRMQLTFTVVFKAHQNLFTHLTHLTNRFHVAVNLYSCNRSQMMSNVVTTKECYTRRHHWFLDQIFISFALLHRPVATDIEYIYFIS